MNWQEYWGHFFLKRPKYLPIFVLRKIFRNRCDTTTTGLYLFCQRETKSPAIAKKESNSWTFFFFYVCFCVTMLFKKYRAVL